MGVGRVGRDAGKQICGGTNLAPHKLSSAGRHDHAQNREIDRCVVTIND